MKRITRYMLVLSTMMLVGTAWAGQDKASDAPQKLTLALDLDDGSHVIGVPGIESIPIQTSYAKMDIQLKQILTIRIEEDHEKASIDLRNGDKLKGVINLQRIKLGTIFGKVTIGFDHIRAIRVALSGGILPETLTKNLVLYYSFERDEGGKVTDLGSKKSDGEVKGANWTPKGKVGGAYEFNGKDSYIDTKTSFSGMEEITVCGWVFLTDTPHDSALVTQLGEGGPEVFGIWAAANGKGVHVNFCDERGTCHYFYGNDFELNKWKFLCVTYAAGKALVLYENGVLVNSAAVPALSLNKASRYTAKVGASQGATGYWAIGLIDEVMIFDRALSDPEIRLIYDAQK